MLATALGVDRARPPAVAAAARDRQLHAARRCKGAHGVAAGSRFSLRCPSRLRPRLPPRRGADRPLQRRRRTWHRRRRRPRGAGPAGRPLVRDLDGHGARSGRHAPRCPRVARERRGDRRRRAGRGRSQAWPPSRSSDACPPASRTPSSSRPGRVRCVAADHGDRRRGARRRRRLAARPGRAAGARAAADRAAGADHVHRHRAPRHPRPPRLPRHRRRAGRLGADRPRQSQGARAGGRHRLLRVPRDGDRLPGRHGPRRRQAGVAPGRVPGQRGCARPVHRLRHLGRAGDGDPAQVRPRRRQGGHPLRPVHGGRRVRGPALGRPADPLVPRTPTSGCGYSLSRPETSFARSYSRALAPVRPSRRSAWSISQ